MFNTCTGEDPSAWAGWSFASRGGRSRLPRDRVEHQGHEEREDHGREHERGGGMDGDQVPGTPGGRHDVGGGIAGGSLHREVHEVAVEQVLTVGEHEAVGISPLAGVLDGEGRHEEDPGAAHAGQADEQHRQGAPGRIATIQTAASESNAAPLAICVGLPTRKLRTMLSCGVAVRRSAVFNCSPERFRHTRWDRIK